MKVKNKTKNILNNNIVQFTQIVLGTSLQYGYQQIMILIHINLIHTQT